jgi:pyroglutamyl-peptidase
MDEGTEESAGRLSSGAGKTRSPIERIEAATSGKPINAFNQSPMKILLSGFNPFAELPANPSQAIVQEIEKRWKPTEAVQLTTEILPTEYRAAEDRIRNLIRVIRPDVVVCLGVAEMRGAINLERVALNWDDETAPDNAGQIRLGQRIVDGPAAYWSTLPLEAMQNALRRHGIPVTFSNHAGTYVCNHVFYSALHEVELLNLGAKCGFIHVPSVKQKRRRTIPEEGLPLETMVSAIESCLEVIINSEK